MPEPKYHVPETGEPTEEAMDAGMSLNPRPVALELARLERELHEALAAAELWSRELREAREATAKATQEAETFRHVRDLLHDEAEEARGERDRMRAEVAREREATDISRSLADALREDNARLRAAWDFLDSHPRLKLLSRLGCNGKRCPATLQEHGAVGWTGRTVLEAVESAMGRKNA